MRATWDNRIVARYIANEELSIGRLNSESPARPSALALVPIAKEAGPRERGRQTPRVSRARRWLGSLAPNTVVNPITE